MPELECSCGYSCGTESAFQRHLARNLAGVHELQDVWTSASAPKAEDAMRLESAIVSNDLTLAREALAAGAGPPQLSSTPHENEPTRAPHGLGLLHGVLAPPRAAPQP